MVTDGLWKYIQNTVNPKPKEQGSLNVERMFIPHYVSCVMCHVSRVTCQKKLYLFCLLKKIGQSGGASQWRSVINGAYPV